jgi:hypothetical protein
MAKSTRSKKPRPSFDREPPPVAGDEASWVPAPTDAATVLVPDSPAVGEPTAAVALPAPAPTRRPPSIRRADESAFDLLSRPFEIVVILGVALLRAFRRPGPLALVAALALSSACQLRARVIWSGAELQEDGALKLAAEEPFCGCLTITNISGNELRLRSMFDQTTVGRMTLKPDERATFRFDWAGPGNDDVYHIDGLGADGARIDLNTAIRIDERSGWLECRSAPCQYGDLLLNMGETTQ